MELAEQLRQIVPENALKIARDILMSQAAVPTSPGAIRSNGAATYCTAAAIALAAATVVRDEDVGSLVRRSVETGSKEAMSEAYERLGWPRDLCLGMMVTNDRADPAERQAAMVHLIDLARIGG